MIYIHTSPFCLGHRIIYPHVPSLSLLPGLQASGPQSFHSIPFFPGVYICQQAGRRMLPTALSTVFPLFLGISRASQVDAFRTCCQLPNQGTGVKDNEAKLSPPTRPIVCVQRASNSYEHTSRYSPLTGKPACQLHLHCPGRV